MNIFVVFLLTLGLTCLTVSWLKSQMKCPPQKVEYRYVKQTDLEAQFQNMPSDIYNDMFNGPTPWLYGRNFGKTVTANTINANFISQG
jgi:hypothetical protein